MNILFDLSATQPTSGSDFHGGSEYAKTVFCKLCDFLSENISLEVFYNPLKKIENSIVDICESKCLTVHFCKTNNELTNLLNNKKYDIFYSALPYLYFDINIPEKTKFIYTVHGLRNLEYPVDKYESKYKISNIKTKIKHILFLFFPTIFTNRIIKKGIINFNKLFTRSENQTIITVSNHSKFAISLFFPYVNISQIVVYYSPLKKYKLNNIDNDKILASLLLSPKKYILLIGGDRSEKGAYRACKVLYKLLNNHSGIPNDIKVIVLGVSYSKLYLKLTNNNPRFIFHDYVSTDDLEVLYKNAFLFLYPTMNEGFGYPPLEAMKYGTLCASSANSAITEIYGDSVIYFNPFDETEMSIRILQSFNENIRNEIKEKMSVRCQLIRARQEKDLDNLVKTIISS